MPKQQNIVGPVIRALRDKRDITQDQFVAKLNLAGWDISRATLSKIEAQIRCVTDYELPLLAMSLGVEPWDLIRMALARPIRKG